jgi:hypothetical protein
MAFIFRGLLMGVSKIYWVGILKNIYSIAGAGNFTWSDLQRRGISKSDLSRLKCSNYMLKNKGIKGKVSWRLNPEAIGMLNSDLFVKKKSRK